ncbi:MAG: FAD-dependent oxidoreductase [Myxococcales bacterium]|nr:FAD-dependent oxidoreductase [Myxococcales bacterium]
MPTVMSMMDREFGAMIAQELVASGVQVVTGIGVSAVGVDAEGQRIVTLADGRQIGRPRPVLRGREAGSLAKLAGLEIGPSGGLIVDEFLRTSDPHVWAAGDMVEVVQKISGRHIRIPLAGPANRQGRIAASNALGAKMHYDGALGTSVVRSSRRPPR